MTGGGTMGSREVPSGTPRAPKPAWGSGAKPSKPAAQAPKPVDKVTPKPASASVKAAPKAKLPNLPNTLGPDTFGTGGQGFSVPGGRLGAFLAGIQAYNTAPGTRDTAPKFPTTANEVKKGET